MNILDYRKDTYSTTGNDGIIEYIFSTCNIKNGFFIEFGAWDGISGSNCRKLFQENWSGIFIEADKKRYNSLVNNYKNYNNITCINAKVGLTESIFDDLIADYIPSVVDFCSIDIDGLDVEIFETFNKCLPTVICIEGGQMLHPFHSRVPVDIAKDNIQQGLQIMVDVFSLKGYIPICSYQDTFFIKKELANLFSINKNVIDFYLDGIVALPGRLPWIQRQIGRHNIKNSIIEEVLNKSSYKEYGYNKRKEWGEKDFSNIKFIVEDIRSIYHKN